MTSPHADSAAPPTLEIEGVTKQFPGVLALKDVTLSLHPGEVHALAGENGAGKSTLIKILCGAYKPDAGLMRINGEPYAPHSPFDAIGKGIRVVHQELLMLEQLSVAENLLFESLPRNRFGWIDRTTLNRRASELLSLVGLESISPTQLVQGLGMAQRQLIEIAKALSGEHTVLIMDEPTATLTSKETNRLFEIIRQLKAKGVAILFVSHHLEELFEICDSVTVLRNGQKVSTQAIQDTSPKDLVRQMVGRELLEAQVRPPKSSDAKETFRVEGLRYKGQTPGAHINFSAVQGEILGIAGLVGAGRTETVRAIFGADPREAGQIFIHGQAINIRCPADAIAHGICLVTEDRKDEGLLLDMPIRANVTLAKLKDYARSGVISQRKETQETLSVTQTLQVRLASIEQPPRQLSGGNQQKIVLSKWLLKQPEILILDEPTRGVDVGAKAEIHRILQSIADSGKTLIVVSSDLPELIQLTDRIIVLSRGIVAGQMLREEFEERKIIELAYSQYFHTGESHANAA